MRPDHETGSKERLLKTRLQRHLNALPENMMVMLRLTLPSSDDLYMD
ncbi:MAG: hypothetical protein GX111_13495 [Clostridiales bacterium]|nr:hypothetical protein [Clostridiales bacterium]